MAQVQVVPIPESQISLLPQMARDFRAALSYVSFYSTDSPFVIQAIQKIHKDFQRLLMAAAPLVLHLKGGSLCLNDADFPDLGDLLKIFQDKNIPGVEIQKGLTAVELAQWLKRIALPVPDSAPAPLEGDSHIRLLGPADSVVWTTPKPGRGQARTSAAPSPGEQALRPTASGAVEPAPTLAGRPSEGEPPLLIHELMADEHIPAAAFPASSGLETAGKTNEALLIFVAEAWQHAQLQKKSLESSPQTAALAQSFERLFDRLLDRMEKVSPEYAGIYQWFRTPPGELLEGRTVAAMFPLLEVSLRNNWTAVLFDPATEGLVAECLAHWGSNGQHDLVEKAVGRLAEGLSGDTLEKQIALTHLMDARPWVGNPSLLEKVLDGLNALLARETLPAPYQSALLLAWDLMESALSCGKERPVLTLLSTMHFHADEDTAGFPGRSGIARRWLFERSTPELIRRFVHCAHRAGQLNHFPLLGEMAAPLLLDDFLMAPATQKAEHLQVAAELKEPVRSALAEKLASTQDEAEVESLIPMLRVCGLDAGLSLQISAWLSKGSREFKMNLLGVIEEVGDPVGGPALRLALFDDSEEIAALAARIIGKIRFTPGLKVLLKAAKIRSSRYPHNDAFLTAVCGSLGDLAQPEALPFLQDIARKKPLLWGKNFPLPVRLEAILAISKISDPEAWHFIGSLMEEKNPPLQEALDKIIHEKVQSL